MGLQPAVGELDQLTRLAVWLECHNLMARYAQFIDDGMATRVAELFAGDGCYETPTVRCVGREQVREFFAAREGMAGRTNRHVFANVDMRVEDAAHASARSVCIEYRSDDATAAVPTETRPALVGDYLDRFVRTDAGWRFADRRVVIVLKREGEVFFTPEPARVG